MKKIYIYGEGSTGLDIYQKVKDDNEVKGWLDSNSLKRGTQIEGLTVVGGGCNSYGPTGERSSS